MSGPEPELETESTLIEHLVELRTRLVRALLGVGLLLLVLLPFASELYTWLAEPLISRLPAGQGFIATNPAGAFFAPVKLAFFMALFLGAPWLLYQAWAFVAPGLYRREKKMAVPLLVSAVLLFYAGCAFAYFLVLKMVFGFLVKFKPDVIALTPDAGSYLEFVSVIFLAFGASFELPVALVILTLLGWVTPQQLSQGRGYAVVGAFVLAALITPPDVISQLMLALPLCLLYEVGIIASRWVAPKEAVAAD
ncbi:twin-arginine translocase subunit TatC [Pseudoxanthomonas kalamensis DSM 18571]|uniref:twin-arginine translocase subunit TatC n=1 Tax=Pseudoxanthomonas kalamensis TaxID=289483 RepID=UPI0013908C7D|nr:twin-arginine translocase subunit TatC [Pseudoxanthomonas kalamensis]KAF1712406.1 twin-arginine translocase subunit TatC [Pseudoxanthomonas kalamensis DSM 18571]